MPMTCSRAFLIATLCLTVAALGGCGGGGPTTLPPAAASFVGEWQAVGYLPDTGNTSTFVGALTAYADGRIDFSGLSKHQDSRIDLFAIDGLRFELLPDRTLRWSMSGTATLFEGGLGPNGEFAILGRVTDDGPGIFVLVRKGAAHNPSDLFGDYQESLAYDGGGFITRSGTYRDSGGPQWSFVNGVINYFGAINGSALVGSGSFSVLVDGTIEERNAAPVFNTGRASADGHVMVYGGNMTPGLSVPAIGMKIRTSSGRTRADLQGDYFVVGVGRDNTSGLFRSEAGTFTADGFGEASARRFVSEDGTLTEHLTLGVPYGVAADGRLTVDMPGAGLFGGAISADGRIAMFSGSETGAVGGFFILLKK